MMVLTLLEWFTTPASPSILVLDGGVSTHLENLLAKRNESFEHRDLWSSSLLLTREGHDDIGFSHRAFAEAGADIISSVTYQCHYGVKGKTPTVDNKAMDGMIQRGIQLARANTKRYGAASLGCYGAALADGSEYRGQYGVSLQTLHDFHSRKLETALKQEPDVLAFETVPDLEEVKAIATLLKINKTPKCACWISMACKNESQLNDGTSLSEALNYLNEIDPEARFVHAIGVNCCDGEHLEGLLETIVNHMATVGPRRGIVFYPNSGEAWDAQTSQWKPGLGCSDPQSFATKIEQGISIVEETWKKLCPNIAAPKLIVGGCCRTSPETIALIRTCIDRREGCR